MKPFLPFLFLMFVFSPIVLKAQNMEELTKQAKNYRANGDLNSEIQVLNKLAYMQWENEKLDEAISSFSRILSINNSLGNINGSLITIYNLGAVYYDAQKYNKAIETYLKGVAICTEENRKKDLLSNYINIATTYQEIEKSKESNSYIEKGLAVAKELNDLKGLRSCYMILAENHKLLGNSEKTMEYLELFKTYDKRLNEMQMDEVKEKSAEEVNKAEAAKRQKEIELKYTTDTLKEVKEISELQKMEINLLNQQKEIEELKTKELESKLEYEKKIRGIFLKALIVAFLLFTIILYQFIQKRKANLLLAEQNEKINGQNKQITDSINYAQTIQTAILPIEDNINQSFDSFVLFKPKDIVSGDFYWYSCIEPDKKWIIATVDCTGHGVPGAFMSMIGNTLLNSIVNEQKIHRPSKILEMLNTETVKALKQDKTENRDGMDLGMCLIEKTNNDSYTITYAGAKRPLLYFCTAEKKLNSINADRISIGGLKKHITNVTFSETQLELKKGDLLYLSSDGFIDQNGPDRKRFGSTKLKELILETASLPMIKQKAIFETELLEYMSGQEQRDDITLLGIRV